VAPSVRLSKAWGGKVHELLFSFFEGLRAIFPCLRTILGKGDWKEDMVKVIFHIISFRACPMEAIGLVQAGLGVLRATTSVHALNAGSHLLFTLCPTTTRLPLLVIN
jgi:hypothetical protein